ncbi:MAG TPA: Gfo/Idh/MocA family oxidoreductase [Chloroflexota bacterium]|nr:Gfo/Idh/MocA family oxidoreductase [Chloroflexota bacterium]
MTRARIGVVGLGRRGSEHIETLAALPDRFELVAVCDVSESLAQETAETVGAEAYSDLNELFDKAKLDIVIVATPADTHHLVAQAAADHGVHMLIETPLGLTRRMMDSIIEAVARAGVKAEVGEQMWRRPPDRLAKKASDAGLIGSVLRVSSYYDDAGHNSVYHTIGRMRVFVGADVDEVRGFTRSYERIAVRPGSSKLVDEHWSRAELMFANGVVGALTYVTNWTLPLRGGHPRFFSIEGTEGFIVTGNGSPNMLRRVERGRAVDYPLVVETRRVADQDVPVRFAYETDPPIELLNPYHDRVLDTPRSRTPGFDGIGRAYELDRIHRAVTENAEPEYGLDRARRDQELSITITEAARLGRTLPAHLDSQETAWEREIHEEFRRAYGFDVK